MMPDDVGGRLDVALVRAGEFVFKSAVEPRLPFPVWDRGVGEVFQKFVVERLRVPTVPVSAVDVARMVGILPAAPRRLR